MHTPQSGSTPLGGVAATRKVGLRPSRLRGRGAEVGVPTLFCNRKDLVMLIRESFFQLRKRSAWIVLRRSGRCRFAPDAGEESCKQDSFLRCLAAE